VPQPINDFQAQFIYQANGKADGATFVVQNAAAGLNAVGIPGGGLGYGGIPQSAAVKFNIYHAASGGMGTRLSTGGSSGTYGSTLPVNLASGDPVWVTLNYNGTNLTEALADLATGASFNTNYSVNIPAAVGGSNTALVGFTGGDGTDASIQTIMNFIFDPTLPPQMNALTGRLNTLAPRLKALTLRLTVAQAGGQFTLSWPAWASNYNLEFTTNLAGPITWQAAPQLSVVTNGQATVTIPVGTANTFFRLSAP
jgi:hypothetical protein